HRVKKMIAAYEGAVEKHNRVWPKHQEYNAESETELRRFVLIARSKSIPKENEATRRNHELNQALTHTCSEVRRTADELIRVSAELHARSDRLNRSIDEFIQDNGLGVALSRRGRVA